MSIISTIEVTGSIVNWINSGSVIDPLSSTTRGNDTFAFTELRKGSGKFPKVHVTTDDRLDNGHTFGAPINYFSNFTILVWFYTRESKQAILDGYKNEGLVEYWLDNKLRSAILGSPATIKSLYNPRMGSFSGAEVDPDFPGLYRGFIPITFSRRDTF